MLFFWKRFVPICETSLSLAVDYHLQSDAVDKWLHQGIGQHKRARWQESFEEFEKETGKKCSIIFCILPNAPWTNYLILGFNSLNQWQSRGSCLCLRIYMYLIFWRVYLRNQHFHLLSILKRIAHYIIRNEQFDFIFLDLCLFYSCFLRKEWIPSAFSVSTYFVFLSKERVYNHFFCLCFRFPCWINFLRWLEVTWPRFSDRRL